MKNIPQHKKLYILLREHIKNGVYKEGDLLPSENELCQLHNLTRPTVRQALIALVHDGFIIKHQGKGSIVTPPSQEIGILSIHGTTSAIGDSNLETKIISKPKVVNWEDSFFFDLTDVEKESGCIILKRLRLMNDKPIFYDITYLPNINLPRFTQRQFENRSLFDILRKHYDIEVKGGTQKFQAVPANDTIAKHLNIKKGKAILHLDRKISTNRNNFHFYSTLYCNTEYHSLYGKF